MPYIKGKNNLKLLIDTGANKNVIRPGILEKRQETKETTIKNLSGNHKIKLKGKENLIGFDLKPQTYFELHFHNFFDGIIGSEFLAKNNAEIDYGKNSIKLGKTLINFGKYFPAKQIFNHTITVKTTEDGDWFVPKHQKFLKHTVIEPGLYKSINNFTTVRLLSLTNKPPIINNSLKLKVNNFETITPIPIKSDDVICSNQLSELIRTNHLSNLEKETLFETLLAHQGVLLKTDEKLTATPIIKHQIKTTDEQPVYTKSYRYPQAFKKDVEVQIKELLENDIICHSTSPYSSPIWVVPKKTDASGKKKVRVVIDYRKLNEKTINDKFPIPQIEEILDSLGKSVYFTTLDLKSGFHQIEMDPESRSKTAFSTALGHFEFNRMPFGLKNAPATFQRGMNNILAEFIGTICFVYLDDIIIIGKNLKDHMENLSKVLERLEKYNLKIQLDKCEFMKRETEFLGHVITQDGIKPDPGKIEKILDWKLPETKKEIKQFLGLSGYYRRFIKDYSKITKPMTKYLHKSEKSIDLKDASYKSAFEELKKIIASDQVLAYPDFDKPFILTTDASNFALGAVLSQMQEKVEKPIAFASRTLTKCETRYSTIEKEALAIMWAVQKFRPYIYGNECTLYTDHKPLQYIKTCNKNQKILTWRDELENYKLNFLYKPGKANVVADALSRKIETKDDEDNFEVNANDILSISEHSSEDLDLSTQSDDDTIHSAEESAEDYVHFVSRPVNYYRNQIVFKIAHFTSVIHESPFTHYHRHTIIQPTFSKNDVTDFFKKYHNGKQTAIIAPENIIQIIQDVYKENFNNKGHFVLTQLIVEDVCNHDRQNVIISKEHERAHRGINEVEAQIKRAYFFPKMRNLIKMHINSCHICNTHKYERKPYNIKISPRPVTEKPFTRVHMDIFIINNNSFLSLVDSFSKHLQMYFIKHKNLVQVQKALAKYFTSFGFPNEIVTDHETTFRSIQLKNYLAQLGVELKYASSSESNGQVERTHLSIAEIFNTNKHKFAGMQTKSIIKLSVALYNDTIHSATKFTPNEIIFNQNNIVNPGELIEKAQEMFLEARVNLEKAKTRQTKNNDQKEDPPQLEDDQEVFVIPNVRSKTAPRAVMTKIKEVKRKTFKNLRNVKRNKSKIKRLKK